MPGAAVVAPVVARPRRVPIRTCVACRTPGGKRGLLRVVRLPDSAGLALDPSGKQSGRGAYVCKTWECVSLALKQKKLERSLKMPVSDLVAEALRVAVNESDGVRSAESEGTAEKPE